MYLVVAATDLLGCCETSLSLWIDQAAFTSPHAIYVVCRYDLSRFLMAAVTTPACTSSYYQA